MYNVNRKTDTTKYRLLKAGGAFLCQNQTRKIIKIETKSLIQIDKIVKIVNSFLYLCFCDSQMGVIFLTFMLIDAII